MAGNRIKGITIEIGGNTTKLTDSLKSVDKSLKDTQSKLKDVNKLLKMDPSNVELLRQKHDLLTKAVEDTKKRQEELKKALENDLRIKATSIGCHREDLSMSLNDRDIGEFGSQGENRIAAGGKIILQYWIKCVYLQFTNMV